MIDPNIGPQGTERHKPWIPLSVVVIAAESDAHWMPGLIATLPPGCELVVLWNKRGDDHEVRLRKAMLLDNGIDIEFYETQWHELDFAALRNTAITKATRQWVLWLDADDRLLTHQHQFFNRLDEYPPGVGALLCGCVGVQPTHNDAKPGEVLRFNTAQVRLFRNHLGFQFEGRAHEQLMWAVQQAAYQVVDCSLIIHHEGYQVDADAMRAKMERNVRALSAELATCDDPRKVKFWTEVLHRDTQSLMFYLTR